MKHLINIFGDCIRKGCTYPSIANMHPKYCDGIDPTGENMHPDIEKEIVDRDRKIADLEALLYAEGKIASTSKQRAQRRERYLKRKEFEKQKADFNAKQIDCNAKQIDCFPITN